MEKEVDNQIDNGNFSVIPRSKVPTGSRVFHLQLTNVLILLQCQRKAILVRCVGWDIIYYTPGRRECGSELISLTVWKFLSMLHSPEIGIRKTLNSKISTWIHHPLLCTESEYTGLSYTLREAIPLMSLLDELKEHGFPVDQTKATVQCTVFKDNSGAIEIATNHKWRPRTKHLNCRLHHLWSYIPHRISVQHIPMDKQPPDILTKPVDQITLQQLQSWLMGW